MMRVGLTGVIVVSAFMTFTAGAHGYLLATGDSLHATAEQLVQSRALGARASRLVIDPARPLDAYDETVRARRAAGLGLMLVVGGLTTGDAKSTVGVGATAIRAVRRWSGVLTVSLLNEPELAGIPACEVRRVHRRYYSKLHGLGVRVLFGELGPGVVVSWTRRMIRVCGGVVADGFAFHGYLGGAWEGSMSNIDAVVRMLAEQRRRLRTPGRRALRPWVTEFGALTRGEWAVDETTAAQQWDYALNVARDYKLGAVVAHAPQRALPGHRWDTSLFTATGEPTRAALTIRDRPSGASASPSTTLDGLGSASLTRGDQP